MINLVIRSMYLIFEDHTSLSQTTAFLHINYLDTLNLNQEPLSSFNQVMSHSRGSNCIEKPNGHSAEGTIL